MWPIMSEHFKEFRNLRERLMERSQDPIVLPSGMYTHATAWTKASDELLEKVKMWELERFWVYVAFGNCENILLHMDKH